MYLYRKSILVKEHTAPKYIILFWKLRRKAEWILRI